MINFLFVSSGGGLQLKPPPANGHSGQPTDLVCCLIPSSPSLTHSIFCLQLLYTSLSLFPSSSSAWSWWIFSSKHHFEGEFQFWWESFLHPQSASWPQLFYSHARPWFVSTARNRRRWTRKHSIDVVHINHHTTDRSPFGAFFFLYFFIYFSFSLSLNP